MLGPDKRSPYPYPWPGGAESPEVGRLPGDRKEYDPVNDAPPRQAAATHDMCVEPMLQSAAVAHCLGPRKYGAVSQVSSVGRGQAVRQAPTQRRPKLSETTCTSTGRTGPEEEYALPLASHHEETGGDPFEYIALELINQAPPEVANRLLKVLHQETKLPTSTRETAVQTEERLCVMATSHGSFSAVTLVVCMLCVAGTCLLLLVSNVGLSGNSARHAEAWTDVYGYDYYYYSLDVSHHSAPNIAGLDPPLQQRAALSHSWYNQYVNSVGDDRSAGCDATGQCQQLPYSVTQMPATQPEKTHQSVVRPDTLAMLAADSRSVSSPPQTMHRDERASPGAANEILNSARADLDESSNLPKELTGSTQVSAKCLSQRADGSCSEWQL